MKLIDADALEEAILMTGTVKVKDEETAYEFAGILANAPAVDAIPVEWLREMMHKPQMTCGNPFGFVLAEWLEEQEAQDGKA